MLPVSGAVAPFRAGFGPAALFRCQNPVNTIRSTKKASRESARRVERDVLTAQSPAKKVLVVEDNELNMKLFCDLLEAYDFQTVESRDGLKAVDLAREHKPDLIIMDIQLPEVSGLDLTRWIKDDASINTIPIMAVTAFAMRQDEKHVREAGCEAYMSKPIQMKPFIETVRKLTAPRTANGAPPRPTPAPAAPTRRTMG